VTALRHGATPAERIVAPRGRGQGTGNREQARAVLEGFASRMATPIHAMRPHEWG
jgi:hypothetical protein